MFSFILSGLNHIASEFYEITKAPDPDNISLDRWGLWALWEFLNSQNVSGEICERLGICFTFLLSLVRFVSAWGFFYFSIVFGEIYERLMIFFINLYIVSGEICERLLNFKLLYFLWWDLWALIKFLKFYIVSSEIS